MSVLHWLYCDACGIVLEDVQVDLGRMPTCETCGREMRITWEHGKPPATDCYGVAQYSDAAGREFTSHRQKVAHMKDPRNNPWGVSYEEAGDKVGGARPDLSIKKTGFSYEGQRSRVSTGER